jgi:hypothetical protein
MLQGILELKTWSKVCVFVCVCVWKRERERMCVLNLLQYLWNGNTMASFRNCCDMNDADGCPVPVWLLVVFILWSGFFLYLVHFVPDGSIGNSQVHDQLSISLVCQQSLAK